MLSQIGYSLIDSSNTEIMFWGNTLGQSVSSPERIMFTNGNIIEGGRPYELLSDGSMLVERWVESNPTTEIDEKVGETIEFRDNKVVVTYEYALPELSIFQLHTKNKLAYKRWEVETGGAIINGNTYATDRESQTKYTAVAVAISQADPMTWSINWKTNDGEFVVLNAQQMMTAINYVMYHVQNSFNKEYEFQVAIDACTTVAEVLAVDIDNGWPSNEYTTP
jgi:hypothetical protein